MQFAFPWAFILLVPWAVAAWRVLRKAGTRGTLFASATQRFAATPLTWRYVACRWLPIGFLLGTLALIVGAAGPQALLNREVKGADALAVMMAVDISGSMRGLDLSTENKEQTRLDVVKETFRTFVENRPDDLIGLVAFGGYASTRSPLTADHQALLHTLAGVTIPNERTASGEELATAIGDGLSVALLRLKDAEPTSKIVILLSDGESNAGAVSPKEATEAAKKMGVKVYTIGVGSAGRRLVPVRATDAFGRSVLTQAMFSLDEKTLREIAQSTGGTYANVRSQEDLQASLEAIEALETTHVERQIYVRYRSLAKPWLLGGSLVAFLSAGALALLLRRPV